MTVYELREVLSQYDDNVEVFLHISDIMDKSGFYIDTTCPAKEVIDGDEYGIKDGIMIWGK